MHFSVLFVFALCGVAHSKLLKMSCKRIRAFVDGHNSRRLLLAKGKVPGQPAASDMKLMAWDVELAMKAAEWASKKEFNHNPDQTIDSGRFQTGENLCWHATKDVKHKLDIESCLKSWFEENKYFTFGPLTRSQLNASKEYQIDHYTQMAWAETVFVGCAISRFWDTYMKHFLVVCNYGPRGNYMNLTPYRTDQGAIGGLLCDLSEYLCYKRYGDKC